MTVEAEQSALGGMMLSPSACTDVLGKLRAGDFDQPRHELIFTAIAHLHAKGDPTDVIAVVDELIRTGELQQAGGVEYVHSLTSIVPTASNAGYYAGIVRQDATRRGLVKVGARMQASAAVDPGPALAEAMTALTDIRDRTNEAAGETHARWLSDVLNVPEADDAYEWVIPDLLERQDRLMLSAGEGVGKSTLLRQFSILAAAGIHPMWFTPITPIRVLVIDAENSERQWRRSSRALADTAEQRGARSPIGNIGLHCVPVMDLTTAADLGRVHKWIDEVAPDLLVLGPLYRMAKGSLNTDDDVEPVLRALDSLRERDVAMVIEVHAGHARATTGERELRPRGSSALLGWPEFGLGLRRDREIQGRRRTYSLVRWRGDRDRREWPEKLARGQVFPWEPVGTFA